jgi:putative membrane protein
MRTIMAADRTLMAWIRTALSMLSFSFAIYKILEDFEKAGNFFRRENTPRNVGLFLAVMGTSAMVMGTVEYWCTLQDLRQDSPFRRLRPTLIMAVVMSITGLLLVFGILTRLL